MLNSLAVMLTMTNRAELNVWAGLDQLPAFNPDIEHEETHAGRAAVERWRDALRAADAVLFACPEYGHGVPGALKNALDWVVGAAELVGKPVAVVNAYGNRLRGGLARASLEETLRAMDARLVEQSASCPPDRNPAIFAYSLRECLEALCSAAENRTPILRNT